MKMNLRLALLNVFSFVLCACADTVTFKTYSIEPTSLLMYTTGTMIPPAFLCDLGSWIVSVAINAEFVSAADPSTRASCITLLFKQADDSTLSHGLLQIGGSPLLDAGNQLCDLNDGSCWQPWPADYSTSTGTLVSSIFMITPPLNSSNVYAYLGTNTGSDAYFKGTATFGCAIPTPTINPTTAPTLRPTGKPVYAPTIRLTFRPSTFRPSTRRPSTVAPTTGPTLRPSHDPTSNPIMSSMPTEIPSEFPTAQPLENTPSSTPTFLAVPIVSPPERSSQSPSELINQIMEEPTIEPIAFPTTEPTDFPTAEPTRYNPTSPVGTPSRPAYSSKPPAPMTSNRSTAAPSPAVKKFLEFDSILVIRGNSQSLAATTVFNGTSAMDIARAVAIALGISETAVNVIPQSKQRQQKAPLAVSPDQRTIVLSSVNKTNLISTDVIARSRILLWNNFAAYYSNPQSLYTQLRSTIVASAESGQLTSLVQAQALLSRNRQLFNVTVASVVISPFSVIFNSSIATATLRPSGGAPQGPSRSNSNNDPSSLSLAIIIGIAAGGALAVCILALLGYMLFRRCNAPQNDMHSRNRKRQYAYRSQMINESDDFRRGTFGIAGPA